MINVVASIYVKEGHMSEFVKIFKSNVATVLEEKGCVEYVPTVDVQTDIPIQECNANVVTIIEKWDSVEDLKAHLEAPHMRAYQEKVKGIVEKVEVKVLKTA